MSISLSSSAKKMDLDPKKIAVLLITFIVATVMTLYGWSMNCFGMFLIGVGLYMVPHLVGINSLKLLTAYGAMFTVIVILIGSFVIAPGIVNTYDSPVDNEKTFYDVDVKYEGDDVIVNAYMKGDVGIHKVQLQTYKVEGVNYNNIVPGSKKAFDLKTSYDAAKDVTAISGTCTLDDDSLYAGLLIITKTNDKGEEVQNVDFKSNLWIFKDLYKGDLTQLCLYGIFMATLPIIIIFFMILYFSAFMRMRLEKAREKMEKEGRLYPKGYGKCDACGHVVLPGETNCRKCGAAIERPEEVKPHFSNSTFTCSDCGAVVPEEATVCPKCGASFDEEPEVRFSIVTCPRCGIEIPEGAEFCPKCGKDLKK
jgi:ribosomal protein L40E